MWTYILPQLQADISFANCIMISHITTSSNTKDYTSYLFRLTGTIISNLVNNGSAFEYLCTSASNQVTEYANSNHCIYTSLRLVRCHRPMYIYLSCPLTIAREEK